MTKSLNTLFVVGVILAGIFVGPTAASTYKGGRRFRTMEDVKTNQKIVSLHADVESRIDLADVEGTIDALLHWEDGVTGNVITDNEDGSHCTVNADPSRSIVTFSSGHKLVTFTYSDDGYGFVLQDDTMLDGDGVIRQNILTAPLILGAITAREKGMLHRDIATLFDCTVDFFSVYQPGSGDGRGIFDSILSGIGDLIAPAVDLLTPDIMGCPISQIAGLAASIVLSLTSSGIPAGTRCFTEGIAPALSLFTTGFTDIVNRVVGVVSDLSNACGDVSPAISRIVTQITSSCFFNDSRRMEFLELTKGSN